MRFSSTSVESRGVQEEYPLPGFPRQPALPCWEQRTWARRRGKALLLLHDTRKVLLSPGWGGCWSGVGPPEVPLPPSSPPGAGPGERRGKARAPRQVRAPPAPLGSASAPRLGIRRCLWAPGRSRQTKAKEALHPRSLKLLELHICSPSAAPRSWGFVSKWGTFFNFRAAERKSKKNNKKTTKKQLEMEEIPSTRSFIKVFSATPFKPKRLLQVWS